MEHNAKAVQMIRQLALDRSCPHIILNGPSGCGKKSLVNLFLKTRFPNINIHRVTQWLKMPGVSKEKEIPMFLSKHHLQFKPHVHSVYDKNLIAVIMSEMLMYKTVGSVNHRIIVVENAEKLTLDAQESLKKVLEDRIGSCRFIFLNNNGFLISPIVSRCLLLHVSPPNDKEKKALLRSLNAPEDLNLKQCFSVKDVVHAVERHRYGIAPEYPVKVVCNQIIEEVLRARKPDEVIYKVRKLFYLLINYNVTLREVLCILTPMITAYLVKAKRFDLLLQVAEKAVTADYNMMRCNKSFYHLERFVISILCAIN